MKGKRRSIVRSVTSLLLWIEKLGFSSPFLMASIDPIWGRRSALGQQRAALTWDWLGLLAPR